MTIQETKKRKLDQNVLTCEYILPRKNRRCKMLRKKDAKYCSEHLIHDENFNGERIACPFSSSHTVWKKDLKQHMKKCNDRPKENTNSCYELDFNKLLNNAENFELANEEEEENTELIEKYIHILQKIEFESLEFRILHHEGLETRLQEKTNQKHPIQQNSIIANMDLMGLLSNSFLYLEFGAGKGELLRYLNQCILQQKTECSCTYGFGLIDRGKNRLKADSKIISDSETLQTKPQIKRSKIDIKDLNLDKFLVDLKIDKVVAISKHLCGAATDLTLKLILNSTLLLNDQFGGALIAMCCRHVCSLEQLLPQSRKYLHDHGFTTVQSFNVLKKLVSWAVDKKDAQENGILGLNTHQREEIGLKARRLIDESRVHALKSILNDKYKVEIFWYVQKDVTLENVCLSISRRTK